MEGLTLELGSSKPFWELPYKDWSVLATDHWLTSTWKDLSATDLTLRGPMEMIEPQRQHDRHLNDLFFAVGSRGGEFRRLDRCKMFLKINTLADATTADGRKIEPDVLAGNPLDRNSPYDWPRVHPPSHRDWDF